MRIEHQILLECARYPTGGCSAEVERLTLGQVDWTAVTSLAAQHGVTTPLYGALGSASSHTAPAPVLDQLQARCQATARSNLALTGELVAIHDLLEPNGIRVIPYKGPVLTQMLYGDLAQRPFEDIDILVSRADVLKARDLLERRGFQPVHRFSPRQTRAFLDLGHAVEMQRPEDGVRLEIHWQVVPRCFSFTCDNGFLWRNLQKVQIGGREMESFLPEELLLVLCAHGAKHAWSNLKMVRDLAHLVGRFPDLDWQRVLRQAQVVGNQRVLFVGLAVARNLLGVPLPADVASRMARDPAAEELAKEVGTRLFTGSLDVTDLWRFHLRTEERFSKKARYWLVTLSPAVEEWTVLPLPDRLYLLYYLFRPFKLARKYGSKLLSRPEPAQ